VDPESEAQLWQRSLSGDGSAFGHIFDEHRGRLFLAALRIAPTKTDAEDLVASTFLELWRAGDRVRVVNDSLLPWMLVTLNNLGRNAARGRSRHRRFIATMPPPSLDDVALDEVEELHSQREAMALLRALPQRDAAILALTAFEGYSAAEAAAALGISAESARARLSRARQRARAHVTANTTATEGQA
jgi:RNA polymerase sigma-70 factor (ECF subfamily)